MNQPVLKPQTGDLLLLILLSTAVKMLAIYFVPVINPDGIRYINAAREFLEGDYRLGLSYVGHLPALPLLLAGARQLIPDWALAGQALSVAGFTMAAIPVYLLTRDLFGRPAALGSGLAFILSPAINGYAAEILREPLSICFLLWAAWLGRLALAERRPTVITLTSILALLATFFRLESALFLPAFLLLLLFDRSIESGKRLKQATLAAFPWAVVFALLYFSGALGAAFSGGHGIGILASEIRNLNLLGTYPEVYASFSRFEETLPNAQWSQDAAEIARHYLPLIYLIGLVEALVSSFYLPFFILALVGLIRTPGRSGNGRFLLLLAGIFLLGAYLILLHRNFISDRYLLAPVAFLFPWVGAGLEWIRRLLLTTRRFRMVYPLYGLFLVVPLIDSAGEWQEGGGVLKRSGEWLKGAKGLENVRLICNDERVPFYAGLWRADYVVAPTRDPGEMAGFASTHQIDLIVLESSSRSARLSPPDDFDLLHEFSDTKNRVAIYRRQP